MEKQLSSNATTAWEGKRKLIVNLKKNVVFTGLDLGLEMVAKKDSLILRGYEIKNPVRKNEYDYPPKRHKDKNKNAKF